MNHPRTADNNAMNRRRGAGRGEILRAAQGGFDPGTRLILVGGAGCGCGFFAPAARGRKRLCYWLRDLQGEAVAF